MNTSGINSLTLALIATIGLSGCDTNDGESEQLRSIISESGVAELSVDELEQLSALAPTLTTPGDGWSVIETHVTTSGTASDEYDWCVDDCADDYAACEVDIGLACVYQEPACDYPEVCDIALASCLDNCESLYTTNGVGNGTGDTK